MGWLSDFASDPIGTLGSTGQKVLDNPLPAAMAYFTGNPAALMAYGAPSGGANNATNYGNILQGGVNQYGGMLQGQVSKEAIQAAQNEARNAGQQASSMAMFRPVGITTRFGSSNFQVDPKTGQLISAGYSASPEITAAQNRLMGLGAGYLAASPDQVAADYMAKQQALLAPGRERESALLANQLQNSGRTGLSVAQGGGLLAANPEQAALANARAMQDLQLAANANAAGQQQVQFGTGLFGQAGQLEQLAQQPLELGASLGAQSAAYGGQAGRLGLAGSLDAAKYGLLPELQYSPQASVLKGITSPTSTLGMGVAGLLGSLLRGGGSAGSYTGSSVYDGSPTSPNTYLYDNPMNLFPSAPVVGTSGWYD